MHNKFGDCVNISFFGKLIFVGSERILSVNHVGNRPSLSVGRPDCNNFIVNSKFRRPVVLTILYMLRLKFLEPSVRFYERSFFRDFVR